MGNTGVDTVIDTVVDRVIAELKSGLSFGKGSLEKVRAEMKEKFSAK